MYEFFIFLYACYMQCADYPRFVHISNVLDLLELEYGGRLQIFIPLLHYSMQKVMHIQLL
jgi:hypothetical protein